MSSRAVRTLVRGWAATLATPFHETVNVASDPSEDIWFTISFDAFEKDVATLCDKEERGEIELNYFAPAGTGDDAVLAAIEADVLNLLSKVDTSGKFRFTGESAPDDFGMPNASFRMSVRLEYAYFT